MAISQATRVFEEQIAAAGQRDQQCVDPKGCLVEGRAAQDLALWIRPGTDNRKQQQDLEQCKQKQNFNCPFSALVVTFIKELGAFHHCSGFLAPNGCAGYGLSTRAWSGSPISEQTQDLEQYNQRMEFYIRFLVQDASPRTDLGSLYQYPWRSVSMEMAICDGAKQGKGNLIWGVPRTTCLRTDRHTHHVQNMLQDKEHRSDPLRRGIDLAQQRPHSTDLAHTNADLIQIFVKSLEGKHYCMRLRKATSIQELKKEIQGRHGIPERLQNLIYSGFNLQDNKTLQHYGIANDSTINLTLRLRGGSPGTSAKNTGSFRDAVKGKEEKRGSKAAPASELPGPYIVEQKPESPTLQVSIPEVINLYTDLSNTAVICRFNGFWPKSDALHQWIYTTWSPNCEIYLYPKGFFIVSFDTEQERDSIIKQGPWFWGNAGLFTTPWFPGFDANTMKVSTIPVWVRLHGLPLHFWHHKVLIAIGNSLGKFLKMDEDRAARGIFTFARICVEVDLSQGLPDHITLNFNNTQWNQQLDYENTTFRWRDCLQTGHLQNGCPSAQKDSRNIKKHKKKPKGWQHTEPLEEEDIKEDPPENHMEPEPQKGQEQSQEAKNLSTHMGLIITDLHQELQIEVSGIKRTHSPEGSESDKEQQMNTMGNQLATTTPTVDSGGWRRLERKKGRKE